MLEGRELDPTTAKEADLDRIASDLGTFVVALHRLPVDEPRRLGVPDRGLRELAALRGSVTSILEPEFSAAQRRVMDEWWDGLLSDPALAGIDPVLAHADLWYVHVLVDQSARRVVGVLDFGDACIADPAADFAPMLYLGRDFTALVVDAYEQAGGDLGRRFDDRLRRCWEIREVEGLPYDARYHPAELPAAIDKVLQGPIFDRSAPTW
jgi:aminoglycoside phosphotransferase (APT) family kinase protein